MKFFSFLRVFLALCAALLIIFALRQPVYFGYVASAVLSALAGFLLASAFTTWRKKNKLFRQWSQWDKELDGTFWTLSHSDRIWIVTHCLSRQCRLENIDRYSRVLMEQYKQNASPDSIRTTVRKMYFLISRTA